MKNKFRIILDIIMLIMIITLFNKSLISLSYHEIAGLILIGIMIIHIIINIKIIKAMCEKFAKIPTALKVGTAIDLLLIVCFAWIGISGIFISHTIFTSISSNNMIFKLGHMFAGGLSVILLGIHIGLHICRKPMPSVTAVIITAVVLFGGIFGIMKSSELRWLSIPVTAALQTDNGEAQQRQAGQKNRAIHSDNTNENEQTTEHSETERTASPNRNIPSSSLPEKASNVFMFLCMILLCAMITYWIIILHKRRLQQCV